MKKIMGFPVRSEGATSVAIYPGVVVHVHERK